MSREDEARRLWFRHKVLPLNASLLKYATKISLNNGADADDLVQETFARLISYSGWRDIDHVERFAVTVLRNLVYQEARHRKVVPIHAVAELETLPIIDDAPGADRMIAGRDELLRLSQIIDTLPPQCRKVFLLRKISGLAPKEIAESLGLSVSTIEKHLVKGLRICAQRLALDPAPATLMRHDDDGCGKARASQGGGDRVGHSPWP